MESRTDYEEGRSRRFGALFGLAVGDALGATLEFAFAGTVPPHEVSKAMTMPGGGCHGVAPGQVTDDTELALALASALAGSVASDGFPRDRVEAAYRAWFASDPFDVGATCGAAFGSRYSGASASSQSNGSLMRIAPLAVWAASETDGAIARLAIADASLSHASGVVHASTAAYAIALAALVRGETAEEAVGRATSWLESRHRETPAAAEAAAVVLAWATEPMTEEDVADVHDPARQGWAKHAFSLAFHHLRTGTTFGDAMRHVLGAGGDTDTNAGIVGALIGARVGLGDVGLGWVARVEDCVHELHERPEIYHPREFSEFVYGLCHEPEFLS